MKAKQDNLFRNSFKKKKKSSKRWADIKLYDWFIMKARLRDQENKLETKRPKGNLNKTSCPIAKQLPVLTQVIFRYYF